MSNYHKHSGLTAQTYFLTFVEIRSLKIKVSIELHFFLDGGCRGKSISLSFPVSRGCLQYLDYGPFLHPEIQPRSVFKSFCVSFWTLLPSSHLWVTLLPPSFPYIDPHDYNEPTQIIQGNLLISRSLTSSHPQNHFCCVE